MGKKGALIEIAGEFFKSKRKHFAFETLYKQVENMKEFKKLTLFSSLESVSLNGTNINDEG
jgi:DNA-directed RNA polymerase delta subunit